MAESWRMRHFLAFVKSGFQFHFSSNESPLTASLNICHFPSSLSHSCTCEAVYGQRLFIVDGKLGSLSRDYLRVKTDVVVETILVEGAPITALFRGLKPPTTKHVRVPKSGFGIRRVTWRFFRMASYVFAPLRLDIIQSNRCFL